MKSCFELSKNGFTSNGVYHLIPDGGKPMQVLCDMTTDGGEAGPFFRDVYTARWIFSSAGNSTKMGLVILVVSSGLETTIFTDRQPMLMFYLELTWRTLIVTLRTLNIPLLIRSPTREINTAFCLEDTMAQLVTRWQVPLHSPEAQSKYDCN